VSENHKRLIEDYLPVRELNEIAAKEKKHPEHPVALIHYWPARRPITACRAAIYAALVAAPRTSEDREHAARFVTNLANFKFSPDVIAKAADRIKAQHGGQCAKVLDIFSGGGAIPLEAARLGCDAHAVEYNPVAHLVELCTLVFPQRFGVTLADDVSTWGKRIIKRLRERVTDWYPQVHLDDSKVIAEQLNMFGAAGESASVDHEPVAYIWVRTVPCRNPQCRSTVPLVRQAWLRKKGGLVSAVPTLTKGSTALTWEIVVGSEAVGDEDEQTGAGGLSHPSTCQLCQGVRRCGEDWRITCCSRAARPEIKGVPARSTSIYRAHRSRHRFYCTFFRLGNTHGGTEGKAARSASQLRIYNSQESLHDSTTRCADYTRWAHSRGAQRDD